MKKGKAVIIFLVLSLALFACVKDNTSDVMEEDEDHETGAAVTLSPVVNITPEASVLPAVSVTPAENNIQAAEANHPATLPTMDRTRIIVIDDEDAMQGEDSETENDGEPAGGKSNAGEKEYPIRVDNGKNVTLDLDSNGTNDTVNIDVTKLSIKINGKEFGDRDRDGSIEDYDIYPDNPSDYGYYITDINKSDNYKEIALLEFGPSDDLYSYFFRYDNGTLDYIGGIPDFPFVVEHYSNNKNGFNGAGKISGDMRLNVFQTWWAPVSWKLNQEGKIELIEQDWYYPTVVITDFKDKQLNRNTVLLRELMVYEAPDTESAQIVLKPNDSLVYFLATDNKSWIWLKREDGTGGFLNLNYYDKMLYGSDNYSEIFLNLCMAD